MNESPQCMFSYHEIYYNNYYEQHSCCRDSFKLSFSDEEDKNENIEPCSTQNKDTIRKKTLQIDPSSKQLVRSNYVTIISNDLVNKTFL